MPANTTPATNTLAYHKSGHAYKLVYANDTNLKNAIVSKVNQLKDKLDETCEPPPPPVQACGSPIRASGGQLSSPETYRIDLGGASGRVQWEFEAYGVPDQFDIKLNGRRITGSNGLESGYSAGDFHVLQVNSPSRNTAEITVTAPNSGTAWYANIGCPGQSIHNTQREQVIVNLGYTRNFSCKARAWLNNKLIYDNRGQYEEHQFTTRISINTNTDNILRYETYDCSGSGACYGYGATSESCKSAFYSLPWGQRYPLNPRGTNLNFK